MLTNFVNIQIHNNGFISRFINTIKQLMRKHIFEIGFLSICLSVCPSLFLPIPPFIPRCPLFELAPNRISSPLMQFHIGATIQFSLTYSTICFRFLVVFISARSFTACNFCNSNDRIAKYSSRIINGFCIYIYICECKWVIY